MTTSLRSSVVRRRGGASVSPSPRAPSARGEASPFGPAADDFLAANAEYAVVSNPRATEDILNGRLQKDLDVLLTPSLDRRLRRSLLAAGMHVELKRQAPFKALFFDYRAERRQLFMLDLYRRYVFAHRGAWFELKPKLREAILASAARGPSGLRHVAPHHRMLFVVLGILVKGNPHGRYGEEIAANPAAVDRLLKMLVGELRMDTVDANEIRALLTGGIEPSAEATGRLIAAVGTKLSKAGLIGRWFARYAAAARHVLFRRPPMVAVVGLDGAGKSTLIRELTGRLPIKHRVMYWASRNMILPTTKLHRWLERTLFGRDVRRTDAPERKPLPGEGPAERRRWRGLWKLPALALLNANKYAEYLAKYLLLRAHMLRGCIGITDRYVCDEQLEYGDRFRRWNSWIYRRAYPRPSMLVVMTVSPETLHARKPSIPVETARHYLEAYRVLAEEYARRGVPVLTVDSEQNPARNADRVLEALFEHW